MHLVKWLRRNNRKVMAIVVIVIMVGFVGGTYLTQLGRRRSGLGKTAAYLGDAKVTQYDLAIAQRQLEVLNSIGAPALLSLPQDRRAGSHQLYAALLGELLFSSRSGSPQADSQIRRIASSGGLRIKESQIDEIYRRPMGNHVYWYCLKTEAYRAGIAVSRTRAGQTLGNIIPKIFGGASYRQVVGSLINRYGIPEKEILSTFADLLAVLEYTTLVCSNEAFTSRQLAYVAACDQETVNTEFVRFDAADFESAEPTDAAAAEQFARYRHFPAGSVTEDNPYGFGYRLPETAMLEYLGVRLDDVSSIIDKPTEEQAEDYYQRHRADFTEQVPSDPNDPNSPITTRQKSYAEVANSISRMLLNSAIDSRASEILHDASSLIEQDPSLPFQAAADRLAEQHGLRLYAGKTGRLDAEAIRSDEYLARLYIGDSIYDSVELARKVFAVGKPAGEEPAPEIIGPARDVSGRIMAILRVADRWPSRPPENLNETFSTARPVLGQEQQADSTYSVKAKVVRDLKRLAAMETARRTAEEFVARANEQGWDPTIERFNRIHGPNEPGGDSNEAGAVEPFRLETRRGLRRTSPDQLAALASHVADYPGGASILAAQKTSALFTDKLYQLAQLEGGGQVALPTVMAFKPHTSYYAIKSIELQGMTRSQYDKTKSRIALRKDMAELQTLAVVHLNPRNILERTGFRTAAETTGGSDEPEADKGSS